MSPVGRSNKKSYVDAEMIAKLIDRNKLDRLLYSESIYQGTCPFCGKGNTFDLWSNTGVFHCYWCGCDGVFHRTPERTAELKRMHQAKMEASEA